MTVMIDLWFIVALILAALLIGVFLGTFLARSRG